MKKSLRQRSVALLGLLLLAGSAGAQTKVGNNPGTLDSSAAFEVSSTNSGFLPPRMTEAQMKAIRNPATWLMTICTDCTPPGPRIYDGNIWAAFGTTASPIAGFLALNCSGALSGTWQLGTPTTSSNTKTVSVTPSSSGSFTASTNTVNGVKFTAAGNITTTTAQPLTLTATGTPIAAGTFTYTVTIAGRTCTFDVPFAGQATFACGNIVNNLPTTLTSGQSYNVNSAITLPYTAGTGMSYDTITVATDGLMLSRVAGTLSSGGGNVEYNLTGTYTGSTGNVRFDLPESGCIVYAGGTTISSLSCNGALAGTYQLNLPMSASNTKGLAITATAGGSYTANTDTLNGVSFAASGYVQSTGATNITMTATGTPQAIGSFTYTAKIAGSTCQFNVTFSAPGSFNCAGAVNNITPNPTLLTPGVSHGGTYTLSYTGGNGTAYGTTSITANGLTLTRTPGTYSAGGGSVVYTVSGTAGNTGYLNVTFPEGCTAVIGCATDMTAGTGAIAYMTYDRNGDGTDDIGWCAREVTGPDSKQWLDRNLGAYKVATAEADNQAYGSLYQWGRKADGHQRYDGTYGTSADRGVDSGTTATTATLATSNTPGNVGFITPASTPYDWVSTPNTARWNNISGSGASLVQENNPCPAGYRLPTQAEAQAFGSQLYSGTYGYSSPYSSTLKMPMSGYRTYDGTYAQNPPTVYGFPNNTYYSNYHAFWTSSISGNNAYIFEYKTTQSGAYSPTTGAGATLEQRAAGHSVRCIKN